jgi:hypothetical protein
MKVRLKDFHASVAGLAFACLVDGDDAVFPFLGAFG